MICEHVVENTSLYHILQQTSDFSKLSYLILEHKQVVQTAIEMKITQRMEVLKIQVQKVVFQMGDEIYSYNLI